MFLFEVFFFLLISLWLDFVFVIVTLEIVLPNYTLNILISSKPYFVIIKTKINQTLVSHVELVIKKHEKVKIRGYVTITMRSLLQVITTNVHNYS